MGDMAQLTCDTTLQYSRKREIRSQLFLTNGTVTRENKQMARCTSLNLKSACFISSAQYARSLHTTHGKISGVDSHKE